MGSVGLTVGVRIERLRRILIHWLFQIGIGLEVRNDRSLLRSRLNPQFGKRLLGRDCVGFQRWHGGRRQGSIVDPRLFDDDVGQSDKQHDTCQAGQSDLDTLQPFLAAGRIGHVRALVPVIAATRVGDHAVCASQGKTVKPFDSSHWRL